MGRKELKNHMNTTKTLAAALLIIATLLTAACSTTTATHVVTVATEARAKLCTYYTAHRTEIDAVRAFARSNWHAVPDQYKPALLVIDAQLHTCDDTTTDAGQTVTPTTASTVLDALSRVVELYRELKGAGLV